MSINCIKNWMKNKVLEKFENYDEYKDPGSPKLIRRGVDNDIANNFPYIFGSFKKLNEYMESTDALEPGNKLTKFSGIKISRSSESYLDDEILSEGTTR